MSAEPITSAQDFASALSDVVTRYMQHLEPSAREQSYAVQMGVTGEQLTIQFHKQPGKPPYIAFTLQQPSDTSDEQRGRFGR